MAARTAAARRTRFLIGTALGLFAAAPACAQVAGMQGPVLAGGAAPTITAPAIGTTVVKANGPRTLIDWNRFDIAGGEKATFVFDDRSDIVLNRVRAGSATIEGTLEGRVGGTTGDYGGNVWLYARDGVIFGPDARVSTGGLLATTAEVSESDFLGGSLQMAFAGATPGKKIDIQGGAQIHGYGGALALVAQEVTSGASSLIGKAGTASDAQGADTEVLYGAATSYTISFAQEADNDLSLLSFKVPDAASGSLSVTPLDLAGETKAGNVYLAAISRQGVLDALINAPGTITATRASNEGGTIVLAGGTSAGAIEAAAGGAPMSAATGTMSADGKIEARLTGNLTSTGALNAGSLTPTQGGITIDAVGDVTVDKVYAWSGANDPARFVNISAKSIVGTEISAGSDVALRARDGNISLYAVRAGDDVFLAATGSITARYVDMSAYWGNRNLVSPLWGSEVPGVTDKGDVGSALGNRRQFVAYTSGENSSVTIGADTMAEAYTNGNFLWVYDQNEADSYIRAHGGVKVHTPGFATVLSRIDAGLNGDVSVYGASGNYIGDVVGRNVSLGRTGYSGNYNLYGTADVYGDYYVSSGQFVNNALKPILHGSGSDFFVDVTGVANFTIPDLAAPGTLTIRLSTSSPVTFRNLSSLSEDVRLLVGNNGGTASVILAGDVSTGAGRTFSIQSGGYIHQTGGAITAGTLTGSAAQEAELLGAGNIIGGLGDFTASGVKIRTGSGFAFSGTIDARGQDVTLDAGGDLSFASGANILAHDVVLSSAGKFDNAAGASAITNVNGGRWLVYLGTPQDGIFGGLDSHQTAIWGKSIAEQAPDTLTGNRYVFAYRPTLTFTTGGLGKTYGQTVAADDLKNLYTVTGFHPGVVNAFAADDRSTAYSGTVLVGSAGAAASADAGAYAVIADLSGLSSATGYLFDAANLGRLVVGKKMLTGSIAANGKVYDGLLGTTGAIDLSGVESWDTGQVSATGAFAFDDKNAGTSKTVRLLSVALAGGRSGNYALDPAILAVTAQADIAKRDLHATATVDGKTYDGTLAATGTIGGFANQVAGETGGATGSFAFRDRNAGQGKAVDLSGMVLAGDFAANYNLVVDNLATLAADIGKRDLHAVATASGKVYDRTLATIGTIGDFTNQVAGETGGATARFAFADWNAGAGKRVALSDIALSGDFAANYNLVVDNSAMLTADIARRSLTVDANVTTRRYDGTVQASGALALGNIAVGDEGAVFVRDAVFAFRDKNAGVDKLVDIGNGVLAGAASGNYSVALPLTARGTITKAPLNVSAVVADKVYDQTIAATGTYSYDGIVAGDALTVTGGKLEFADANAGTGKAVFLREAMLSGADAGNYEVSFTASAGTADITPRAITARATVDSRTYDGTRAATGTIHSFDGVLEGDNVEATGVFTFADRNVGTRSVVVSKLTLTGPDSGNYTLTIPEPISAVISKAAVTLRFTAQDKVYDGTTVATGTVTGLDGMFGDDRVSATGGSFAFEARDAGVRTVSAQGFTLTGDDAGNYALAVPASVAAEIRQKLLTLDFTADGKTYDGTVRAQGAIHGVSGAVDGDALGWSGGDFDFDGKNAGTHGVTVSNVSLTGAGAGNYAIDYAASRASAVIGKAMLTLGVRGIDKEYDGTTTAPFELVSLDGQVAGDQVSVIGADAVFDGKDAGRHQILLGNYAIRGADAGNYDVVLSAPAFATIRPRQIGATASVDKRTYDGTRDARGSITLEGVLTGDVGRVFVDGATFTFDTRNAGKDKLVTIRGAVLAGAESGNYAVTLPVSALGEITRKALAATVVVNPKIYDGTTEGSGAFKLSGVESADAGKVFVDGATFTFDTRDAGANRVVTISGGELTGAEAGNYSVTLPVSALAAISKRVLVVTPHADSKTYDASTQTTGTLEASGQVAGDRVTIQGGSFAFEDANAGTGKAVRVTGVSLRGGDASNYELQLPTTVRADIRRRALGIAADNLSKDRGSPDAALTWSVISGALVGGDQLSGALAREPGESVGRYRIGQGSLTADSNYEISFTPGVFEIKSEIGTSEDVRSPQLADTLSLLMRGSPVASISFGGDPLITDLGFACREERPCEDAPTAASGR